MCFKALGYEGFLEKSIWDNIPSIKHVFRVVCDRPLLGRPARPGQKLTDFPKITLDSKGPKLGFNAHNSATRHTLSTGEDRLSIATLTIEHLPSRQTS